MMSGKRTDTAVSRTAEYTCLARAASFWETNPHYKTNDWIATALVPDWMGALLRARLGRAIYRRCLAQSGTYEYVIARTRYIDAAFERALAEHFDQIVLFGAGFDSRAVRFREESGKTRTFELDVPITQKAKIERFRQCRLDVPPNLTFVSLDFEKELIAEKLIASGFDARGRSLFVLEGITMYLEPAAADATFRTIEAISTAGSRLVFDYLRISVLRGEATVYGQREMARAVADVNEQWHFGLEPENVPAFLANRGFSISDHQDAAGLERLYFQNENGQAVARVNGTHCLVTAERC
jgi:methyltransferase (TIGR00027 family)